MTKVINYPYLNFTLSRLAAAEFFEQHNLGQKHLRDKLRKHHWQTLIAILEIHKHQVARRSQNLHGTPLLNQDPTAPQRIETNRLEISIRTKASVRTISNHIERLMECKIDGEAILTGKIWHGTRRNFELFINPKIALIADRNNRNFVPESPFLPKNRSTENQALTPDNLQSLQLLYKKTKTSNNTSNSVQKVNAGSKTEISAQCQDAGIEKPIAKTINQDTEGRKTPEDNQTGQAAAPEMKSRTQIALAMQVNAYIEALLQLALQLLWKGANVYDGEKIKARAQIAKYFAAVRNEADLEAMARQFKVRLYMADEYLDRKTAPTPARPNPPDRRRLIAYPAKYFDPSYQYGFASTQKWLEKHKAGRIKAKEKRNYNRALKLLNADPHSLSNYSNALAIIKNNCPAMLDQFNAQIARK